MTWVVMAEGEDVAIMHPQHNINVRSIAHGLAQINRFSGAAARPYSVAEHSLLCADIAAEQGHSAAVQLCCLTHDAHESVIGDVTAPVKTLLGIAWRALEDRTQWRVWRALGVGEMMKQHLPIVRAIDLAALAAERRDLLAYRPERNRPWPSLESTAAPEVDLMRAWRIHSDWTEWRDRWLQRFDDLDARIPVRTYSAHRVAEAVEYG